MEAGARTRSRSGVLAGVTSVGSGVVGAGVFTYLFLSLAGRVLGPAAFAPLSTLWAMVFIVGPGLFLPVQQELGRVIAGQRLERGGRHAVTKVALLAGGLSLVTIAGTLAVGPWIIRELFNGNAALLWCFEGSVLSYALTFMVRGVLSGLGEFTSFGRLVATEALARLVVGEALALVGVRSVTAFGIAIVVAPILSTAIVTRFGARVRLKPGTPVSWRDVTRALGWLVLGSTLAQFLANAGPIAVQLLATNAEAGEAGRFLSALVVARLGLYLFQAVQATLLPNVAEIVAKGGVAELDRVIRRVTAICLALAAVTTVGAFVLGAVAVRVLFGSGFAISGPTMAMLAGASSIYVLAMALSGVAIASSGHRLSALSWLGGCCAFVLGTGLSGDLFLRVEIGYLLGSCAAAGILLVGLPIHLRRRRAGTSEALKEASPPAAF